MVGRLGRMVTKWNSRYVGTMGRNLRVLSGGRDGVCVCICACNGEKEFEPKCKGICLVKVHHNKYYWSARGHIASEFLTAIQIDLSATSYIQVR